MARIKSPEKRSAILEAAVHEIVEAGLGAPTAKIARRAGVAEGTLFTYFASKDELLNELYFEIKSELYRRMNAEFPHGASLKERAWYLWSGFLVWAIENPEKRKVSVQLNVSNLITPETRARTTEDRRGIDAILADLSKSPALSEMPAGFAAAMMGAMHEATSEMVAQYPKKRKKLIEQAFRVFWRAVQ